MLDLEIEHNRDIVDKMVAYCATHTGITWAAALRDPKSDEVTAFLAGGRPCYGEMRAYGKDSTRPQDHKPGDLPRPLDHTSLREAVSVRLYSLYSTDFTSGLNEQGLKARDRMARWLFSTDSPWFRNVDPNSLFFHEREDGYADVITLTDTAIDPTVMVSAFMNNRNISGQKSDVWCQLQDDYGFTPTEAFIAAFWLSFSMDKDKIKTFFPNFSFSYFLPGKLDVAGFIRGDYNDLSNGRTWQDCEDYNRPELQDIWLDKSSDAKVLVAEFRQILGIGQNAREYIPVEKITEIRDYLRSYTEAAAVAA